MISGLSTWGKRVGRKLDQIKQLGDSSEKLQYVVTPSAGVVASSSQPCSPLPPKFATKASNSLASRSPDECSEQYTIDQSRSHDELFQSSTNIRQPQDDSESVNEGRENVSRNSTMRGYPKKLSLPECDAVSHDSAPVLSTPANTVQKEMSFRHHKRQNSRAAGYAAIGSSEHDKLWLSREFPEIALRQNETKLHNTRSTNASGSHTTTIKRRVSRVESLRNLFFNRSSTPNKNADGSNVTNTSNGGGGAAAKRRFLLKKRARSTEKDMLSSSTAEKVC